MRPGHILRRAARRVLGLERRRPIRNDLTFRPRLIELEPRVTPSDNNPWRIPLPSGPMFFSAIASDAQGNSVALYTDGNSIGGNYNAYFQRINAQGQSVGDPVLANTPSGGDHLPGGVAVAPDGKFAIVYWGDGPQYTQSALYGRRFNADGTPIDDSEFVISANAGSGNCMPTVAISPDGNTFGVAWVDAGEPANARIFSWDLQTSSDPFPLAANPYYAAAPRLSMAAAGTMLAGYTDPSGGNDAAYVRPFTYAPDGYGGLQVTPGDPVQLNAWSVIPVGAPDGSFVAVTSTGRSLAQPGDVFMQRFAADGSPVDSVPVPVTALSGEEDLAGAARDAAGNLHVAWHDAGSYYGSFTAVPGLYARRFGPDGTPQIDPVRITPEIGTGITTTADSVAVAPDGSLTAAWNTTVGGTTSPTIIARRFDPIVVTETDSSTLVSAAGKEVDVTSVATTFADHVLWEYWVHNQNYVGTGQGHGQLDVGLFTTLHVVTDNADIFNMSGWRNLDAGAAGPVGWMAGQNDALLAPGQEMYFAYSTPASAIGHVTAIASEADFANQASGQVLGPVPAMVTADIAAADPTATSWEQDGGGVTPGTLVVTRDGDTSAALTLDYTVGGNAAPGVDFQPLEGSVTIPAGQPSAIISVIPLHRVTLGSSTLTVSFASLSGYFGGFHTSGNLTILHTLGGEWDDGATPTPPATEVATAPDGRSVLVWTAAGPDFGSTAIYARRFNADDTAADPSGFLVAAGFGAAWLQLVPTLAIDADGNFAVAWATGDGSQANARIYSWDVTSDSGAVALGNAGDLGLSPQISMANGTLVAGFQRDNATPSPAYLLLVNYAADGNGGFQTTPAAGPVTLPDAHQVEPVAADDGSFVAITSTDNVGWDSGQIFLQHFAANGTAVDIAPLPIQASADVNGQALAGAGRTGGDLYIAWRFAGGSGTAANGNLTVQRFGIDGTAITDPLLFSPQAPPGPPVMSGGIDEANAMAVSPDGSVRTAWTTWKANAGAGIEERQDESITYAKTETTLLYTAVQGNPAGVQVRATASVTGQRILWEYWVTNIGLSADLQPGAAMCAFGFMDRLFLDLLDDSSDRTNDLGWRFWLSGGDDSIQGLTGWCGYLPTEAHLSQGETAYFSFTTSAVYSAIGHRPVTAFATNPPFLFGAQFGASGTVLGPVPSSGPVGDVNFIQSDGSELPESLKRSPGGYVPVNDDNDNYQFDAQGNQVLDLNKNGPIEGEHDLIPLILHKVDPVDFGGTYRLCFGGDIRIWRTPDKTGEILSGKTEFDATQDTTVYVEGVAGSYGAATDSVTLAWFYGTGVWLLDAVDVTVYKIAGPQNVPGLAAYTYKADVPGGANGSWSADGGSVQSATATEAKILWLGGPFVGKVAYTPNPNVGFTGQRDVNVVLVDFDFAREKDIKYADPVLNPPKQDPAEERVILAVSSTTFGNAMEGKINVKRVEGPTVDGVMRGVRFIDMGFIQDGRYTWKHADFSRGGQPAKYRRKSNLEAGEAGAFSLDITDPGLLATPPWVSNGAYLKMGPDDERRPFQSRDVPVTDTPGPAATDRTNIFASDNLNYFANSYNILMEFKLYFAVHTTDAQNGAEKVFTQRATANWRFDGSGPVTTVGTSAQWQRPDTAKNSGDAKFTEVVNGEPVPVTTGDPLNVLNRADRQKWDTVALS
jgi:hypothetical protein